MRFEIIKKQLSPKGAGFVIFDHKLNCYVGTHVIEPNRYWMWKLKREAQAWIIHFESIEKGKVNNEKLN